MKNLLLITFMIISGIAQSQAADEEIITVKCSGVLEKAARYTTKMLTAEHIIQLQVVKKDDKDPGTIDKNGKIEFPDGYEVVYNINVQLGKGGFLTSNSDTTSEIRARLQRHTGGNGKIVMGASSFSISQKPEKKKSSIKLEIVNVQALEMLVNNESFNLESDPILFKKNFKEAVNNGSIDEGVVKSAQIECSTL